MKLLHLLLCSGLLGACAAPLFAEDQTTAEPADLIARRKEHFEDVKRALDPVMKKYLQVLSELKTQYTKAGDLSNALAVDRELNKVLDDYKESGGQYTRPGMGLNIVSATCRDLAHVHQVSFTAHARKALTNGGKLDLNVHDCTNNVDPLPGKPKEYYFIYEVNGVRKEKTFNVGKTIDLKRELD